MRTAIIGAGICGLYLAKNLAERGEEVAVFEKKTEIGKEVCSGLFSDRILDFIPESRSLIQNRIDSALIHFPRKTLKVLFSRRFFVMNHAGLDKLAGSLADKAGAKIVLGQELAGDFDRIIGCDGALSETRKSLNLKDPDFYLGIQGFTDKEDNSYFVETWPTKSGFVWKIPRGKETEWGIMEKPNSAKEIFDKFLVENNISPKSTRAWLIPQGIIIPKNQKMTLCGDAAGLTKPWSGGGVIWGLTAAALLLKNFPDFIKYQKEAQRFFGPSIIISKIIKKSVYFLGWHFPWLLPKNKKVESDFLWKTFPNTW